MLRSARSGTVDAPFAGMHAPMQLPDPSRAWSVRGQLAIYLMIVVACTLIAVQVIGLGLQLVHG